MDSARAVSVASEEALVPGSVELAKGMRLMCYVSSVAIRRAAVVLVEELVARAHYVVAAAVSNVPAVPLQKHLVVPLENRRA
jgi:hypothetical protein